jgi:cell division septum initiation protein DivIVA
LQIGEDEIYVELPRAMVGGLRKRDVQDVLLRIAHDYKKLELENRRLWETLEKLEVHPTPGNETAQAGQSAAVSRAETAVVGEMLPGPAGAPNGADASAASNPVGHDPVSHERREPDEVASALLSVAHRAAREMRESTRDECELMLKKARSRAERLERETERARTEAAAEFEQFQALKSEMRDQMRSTLRALHYVRPRAVQLDSPGRLER